MTFDIIDIILFLAAAQAFLLTLLIFHKHRQLYANRFLGLMLLCYSLILVHLIFWETGFYHAYPYLYPQILGLSLLVGPCHYLYARYLMRYRSPFKKIDWLHFLPFSLYQVYLGRYLFMPGEDIRAVMHIMEYRELPLEFLLYNWLITFQGSVYITATLILLQRYGKEIKNVFSSLDQVRLTWLQNITWLAASGIFFFLSENILLLAGINLTNFNLSSLIIALYVYSMGYLGLIKSEVLSRSEISSTILQAALPDQGNLTITHPDSADPGKKYSKSGLSKENADRYVQELIRTMESKKLYRDSGLTLAQLAEILSITPHNLSEVLNTRLGENFFDFINKYRVEEAKKHLSDPQKQNLKILSVALDAGFNSKTSFNTVFKKFTGRTPSDYRRRIMGS